MSAEFMRSIINKLLESTKPKKLNELTSELERSPTKDTNLNKIFGIDKLNTDGGGKGPKDPENNEPGNGGGEPPEWTPAPHSKGKIIYSGPYAWEILAKVVKPAFNGKIPASWTSKVTDKLSEIVGAPLKGDYFYNHQTRSFLFLVASPNPGSGNTTGVSIAMISPNKNILDHYTEIATDGAQDLIPVVQQREHQKNRSYVMSVLDDAISPSRADDGKFGTIYGEEVHQKFSDAMWQYFDEIKYNLENGFTIDNADAVVDELALDQDDYRKVSDFIFDVVSNYLAKTRRDTDPQKIADYFSEQTGVELLPSENS